MKSASLVIQCFFLYRIFNLWRDKCSKIGFHVPISVRIVLFNGCTQRRLGVGTRPYIRLDHEVIINCFSQSV